MDIYTLTVTITIAAAMMASVMYALFLASPEQRCLRDWAVAGLLFFANNVLVLVFSTTQVVLWLGASLPNALLAYSREIQLGVVALLNALLFCAHATLWVGVRRYLGLWPGWPLVLLLGLLVFSGHGFSGLRMSVDHRLMILWSLLMAISVAPAWTIMRSPRFGMRSGLAPLVLLLLLNMARQGLQAGLLLNGQTKGLELGGNNFLQISDHLGLLVFILLCTMACAYVIIRDQAAQLHELAQNDAMTGWRNRRGMALALAQEQASSERLRRPFALIVFDIDHFKAINDCHGHDIGDLAICHVSRTVSGELRDSDGRFRIGGEEFLVVIKAEAASHAGAVAERLRQSVERAPFGEVAITVSVGCALFRLGAEGWEETLKRADQALYMAKRDGRNRSVMHV